MIHEEDQSIAGDCGRLRPVLASAGPAASPAAGPELPLEWCNHPGWSVTRGWGVPHRHHITTGTAGGSAPANPSRLETKTTHLPGHPASSKRTAVLCGLARARSVVFSGAGGRRGCYWNGHGTQCDHPAQPALLRPGCIPWIPETAEKQIARQGHGATLNPLARSD